MSIDLRGLSAKELSTLITQAKQQQNKLAKRTPIATIRSKITKFAKAEGYTLEELFGASNGSGRGRKAVAKPGSRAGRKLGKVAPKYRNPANPKETWTGRGKQPRWMAALTAKGKKPEDFLIKKGK
ncbi:nucleoid protein H-NS [Pseudoxanthomonas wuyuanensis]|uniref:Nucleoid protein H-NS n=1 Tax=Pseudoxanthomonas wuyuanensis TaxID=1073196 RepID=A0A286DC29_9GAMM|nr:DNA-binding protein [Pseudoxanthomonas wuyuanensis]SOD56193.1 nucleoid protein H-NS [Pseudoxanthomonas wuyuanensis]